MTFGFPAYYTEDYFSSAETIADLHESMLDALHELGWIIKKQSRTHVTATTPFNAFSWGEKIDIQLFPDLMVTITSKCSLVTQCVDWGKNRANVRMLLKTLDEVLEFGSE